VELLLAAEALHVPAYLCHAPACLPRPQDDDIEEDYDEDEGEGDDEVSQRCGYKGGCINAAGQLESVPWPAHDLPSCPRSTVAADLSS
jgi:hypothetical protein